MVGEEARVVWCVCVCVWLEVSVCVCVVGGEEGCSCGVVLQ